MNANVTMRLNVCCASEREKKGSTTGVCETGDIRTYQFRVPHAEKRRDGKKKKESSRVISLSLLGIDKHCHHLDLETQ